MGHAPGIRRPAQAGPQQCKGRPNNQTSNGKDGGPIFRRRKLIDLILEHRGGHTPDHVKEEEKDQTAHAPPEAHGQIAPGNAGRNEKDRAFPPQTGFHPVGPDGDEAGGQIEQGDENPVIGQGQGQMDEIGLDKPGHGQGGRPHDGGIDNGAPEPLVLLEGITNDPPHLVEILAALELAPLGFHQGQGRGDCGEGHQGLEIERCSQAQSGDENA